MFNLDTVELIFWAALAAQAVWIVRLWTLCLTGRYKGLASYLIVTTVWGVTASVFQHAFPFSAAESPGVWSSYAWFYVVTRPVIWILFFVVLYECYDRMVARYAGVRRAGQLAMYSAVGAAVALIIGLALKNPEEAGSPRYWYRLIAVHDEGVYLGAAAAVMALVLFRRFFSLPLPANVGVVFAVFGMYFVGTSAIYVAENMKFTDGFAANLRIIGAVLYLICLTFGLLRFSLRGEDTAADFRSAPGMRLVSSRLAERHLERINDQLAKALNV